ncbi:MAG: aminotransferase class III-fold pyridoxal phosphate-dependent enzyme, partial [Rhodobacteraceae bacterium]|nr:aminotransferase class III-fold pyridoxal phosphate-dependent enzyme [Paracoccaceae bacterium]
MKTAQLKNTPSPETILDWDRTHQFHPWASMDDVEGSDYMLVNKGKGIYLWDETGKRFIDGPGGMWCVQIGYGRPEMAEAIAQQVMKCSGGVIVPPTGYHQRTFEICRKHDILYISDEVVTAFGRLGHWFASQDVFGIEPDIITCAKGMTSGYLPLGACILSDRVMERMVNTNDAALFSAGYTYSAHPVCCAAALKNIEIMEQEHILEHVRDISPYFQTR